MEYFRQSANDRSESRLKLVNLSQTILVNFVGYANIPQDDKNESLGYTGVVIVVVMVGIQKCLKLKIKIPIQFLGN